MRIQQLAAAKPSSHMMSPWARAMWLEAFSKVWP